MKTKLEALPLMISEPNLVEVGATYLITKKPQLRFSFNYGMIMKKTLVNMLCILNTKAVEFIVKVTCERRVVDYLSR